ncbi:MAG: hypothetical protein ACTS2F_14620 [Thainema sp.]
MTTEQPTPDDQPQSQEHSWFDEMLNAVGNAAAQSSDEIATNITSAVESISDAATQSGQALSQAIWGSAPKDSDQDDNAPQLASQETDTANWFNDSTQHITNGLGYVAELIQNSVQLQSLTKAVNLDWLLPILDRVDVVKAETAVKRLQTKYPKESPREIAHRIMMEKVLYVGGSGMASSFVPGFATAMFAVDLAATTAIQAEMGYQIAAAYGLDLHDPARKGELLAIFGLSLGSSYALKAGLGLLRNIPIAGAVIGASTNAVALYTVGYAACHFYEAKVSPLTSDAAVAKAQAESDQFLQDAIAQQIIMDQILAHVVIAGQPEQSWENIAPELERLSFSPASIQVIERQHATPTPLEQLLAQVSQDFAIPLLAQCQKIAEADGIVTEEESAVIEAITQALTSNNAVTEKTQAAEDAVKSVKRGLFRFGRKQ